MSALATIDISLLSGTKLKETLEVPKELQLADKRPTEFHRMFRILHPEKGDERLVWDSRVLKEIRAAKDMFVNLIKKGLKPFKVGLDGKATAEVMTEFDASAEEVIFLPSALVTGG